MNTLREEIKEKYPWFDQSDERRNMSDKEILDKYVDVEKSCLSDSEKKQVMDMLYKYKDAFINNNQNFSLEANKCKEKSSAGRHLV